MSKSFPKSWKESFKLTFIVCKILCLWPISYDKNETFWDLILGLPSQIFYCYAFYENRRHQDIYYADFSSANIVGDYIVIYTCFVGNVALIIHNFIVKKKIKKILVDLERFDDNYFYFNSKRRNINADMFAFSVILLMVIIVDYIVFINAFKTNSLILYFGYMLPLIYNLFYMMVIYEILYITKKMFCQINTFLSIQNQTILRINSLIIISRNHMDLTRLAKEQNFVFAFPILGFIAEMFVFNASFTYNSIITMIFSNEITHKIFAVDMIVWILLYLCTLNFMCYCWVSTGNEVSTYY